jgi:hypothetical protein
MCMYILFFFFSQSVPDSSPPDFMEYGLPPLGRVKPRRDRKMAEKQVHIMAKAEKVAPGSDWYIPFRTADAEVWLQENGRVHTVHEESGSSWNRELPKETIGHIQSAGCLGQKEVVTAAHNTRIQELLQEVNVHGKADRRMKLLTIETESRLGTLWDQEQCRQFCSRDELLKAAKEEEMKISWKAVNEESPILEEQYQERFCRRRLDGIGLDMVNREFLAIDFKRMRDARSNYVERATSVAQEQLLEEQDKVMQSYFAQKGGARSQGGEGTHGKGREHVKRDMYA